MSATSHALRDKWFVSFLPLLKSEKVNTEFKGDWKKAAEEHLQRLDWITTVEELWSTMNSLPRIQQLSPGSTLVFARNNKEASFETFTNGSRVVINLFKSPATELGLDTILSCVLGEMITIAVSTDNAVCDVIRISARPSKEYQDMLRIEVWLNDKSYSSKVAEYLNQTMLEKSINASQFSVLESSFGTQASSSVNAKRASNTFVTSMSTNDARELSIEKQY